MSYQANRLIKFSQDLFFVWVLIGATWGYFLPKIAASGSGNISTAPLSCDVGNGYDNHHSAITKRVRNAGTTLYLASVTILQGR